MRVIVKNKMLKFKISSAIWKKSRNFAALNGTIIKRREI